MTVTGEADQAVTEPRRDLAAARGLPPSGGARPGGRLTADGLARAGRDAVFIVLALAAVIWVYMRIRSSIADDTVGFDFAGTVWDGATAIRQGESPYPRAIESEVQVGTLLSTHRCSCFSWPRSPCCLGGWASRSGSRF